MAEAFDVALQQMPLKKLPCNLSCKKFVETYKDYIQSLMNSGNSLLDIFNIIKSEFEVSWNDYPTFGHYVRKSGLVFSNESLAIIKEAKYKKSKQSMLSRSAEAKAATYKKYKNTLDNMPPEVKQSYIAAREATKRKYTSEQKQHRVDAMIATKLRNNSFTSSKPEERLYSLLLNEFSLDDVIRQYSDDRYPFACDFYIKSDDLFIELNGHYTHGIEPFDNSNPNHLNKQNELLNMNQLRFSTSGKVVKSSAARIIDTWIYRDPIKFNYASMNSLKYIAIYPNYLVEKNINKNYTFIERLKEIW